MRKGLKWIIAVGIVLIIAAAYFYSVPHASFEELSSKVDPDTAASLLSFRQEHPPLQVEVDGATWEYFSFGQGDETILFLHGMTGAADIWFQQMYALRSDFRLISLTYPPVDSLEQMSRGVLAIMAQEGVSRVNLIGSSLGGYLAQYLIAHYPEVIERAVFANTFPPNELIAEKNKTIGALLPYLPEWLVMNVLRDSFEGDVYTASGNSELVLAYLLEQSYGRMTKAQVVGRFHCVVDPFTAPDVEALGIPVMIIEVDNDPLVEEVLREQLKATYPGATVHTLHSVGHFPYLNAPNQGATSAIPRELENPFHDLIFIPPPLPLHNFFTSISYPLVTSTLTWGLSSQVSAYKKTKGVFLMKKTLLIVAVVGVAVAALVVGGVGFAYAQDDDPSTPFGHGFGRHGGFGHGMFGWDGDGEVGPMHETMQAAIAEALGMTVEELEAAHELGKTAWDIAQEQGLTEDEFSTLISDARMAGLEQAVADGTISQEQADWIQSRWEEMAENGFGPGKGGCDGEGHHGGRGPGGSFFDND